MECPRCGAALATESHGSLSLERCAGCNGIWCDAQELNQAREALDASPFGTSAEGKLPSGGSMKCPKDGKELQAFHYAYESDIELDRCPFCEGVWLDEGELAKVDAYLEEAKKAEVPGHVKQKMAEESARVAEKADPLPDTPVARLVRFLHSSGLFGR